MALENLSPYGCRIGTGAASLDLVIKVIPLEQEFTEEEVAEQVRRWGLTERGAVYEHLYSLQQRGHIRRTDAGWVRIN
jgi:hypothetical protein